MAEKMDLDALEVRNLGRVIRADDWMALLRYARRMERRVIELERASQPGGGEAEALGWYEAERSCEGANLRDLLHFPGPMTHSGRMHWQAERPQTTNPVWPVFGAPSAGNGGAEERKPIGYMNERAVSILAQGSVMCTHVSPVKTEFQQIAIYKEPV